MEVVPPFEGKPSSGIISLKLSKRWSLGLSLFGVGIFQRMINPQLDLNGKGITYKVGDKKRGRKWEVGSKESKLSTFYFPLSSGCPRAKK